MINTIVISYCEQTHRTRLNWWSNWRFRSSSQPKCFLFFTLFLLLSPNGLVFVWAFIHLSCLCETAQRCTFVECRCNDVVRTAGDHLVHILLIWLFVWYSPLFYVLLPRWCHRIWLMHAIQFAFCSRIRFALLVNVY